MVYRDADCFCIKAPGRRNIHQRGMPVGISEATFYNWKSMYGGMEASDVKRMKELEEENSRLKRMYASLAMDNEILRDLFTKKGWALPPKGS